MAAYTSIDNPELYFQTKIYSGTGSEQAITLDGDENMQPDFVWIKCRSNSETMLLEKIFEARRATSLEHASCPPILRRKGDDPSGQVACDIE